MRARSSTRSSAASAPTSTPAVVERRFGDVREDDPAVRSDALQRREAEQSLAGTDVEDGVARLDLRAIEDAVANGREPGEVLGAHALALPPSRPVRSHVAQTSVSGTCGGDRARSCRRRSPASMSRCASPASSKVKHAVDDRPQRPSASAGTTSAANAATITAFCRGGPEREAQWRSARCVAASSRRGRYRYACRPACR